MTTGDLRSSQPQLPIVADKNASSKSRKPQTRQLDAKQNKKKSASSPDNYPKHKKTAICFDSDKEDEYQEKLDILFAYERQLKNPSSLTEANLLRLNKLC